MFLCFRFFYILNIVYDLQIVGLWFFMYTCTPHFVLNAPILQKCKKTIYWKCKKRAFYKYAAGRLSSMINWNLCTSITEFDEYNKYVLFLFILSRLLTVLFILQFVITSISFVFKFILIIYLFMFVYSKGNLTRFNIFKIVLNIHKSYSGSGIC